jgi:hypothetical protein
MDGMSQENRFLFRELVRLVTKPYRLRNYAESTDQHRVSPLRRFCRVSVFGLVRKGHETTFSDQIQCWRPFRRRDLEQRETRQTQAWRHPDDHDLPGAPFLHHFHDFNIVDNAPHNFNNHLNRTSDNVHDGSSPDHHHDRSSERHLVGRPSRQPAVAVGDRPRPLDVQFLRYGPERHAAQRVPGARAGDL